MLPKPHVPVTQETYKARIVGPTEATMPGFMFQGLPLPIAADLPEGGFLQVIVGENPMGQAIPGVQIPKGAMVCILVPEVAAQIRPGVREMDKRNQLKILPA